MKRWILPIFFRRIDFISEPFASQGIAGREFGQELRRRETVCSHAIEGGILFLPYTGPAEKTQLSFLLLRHRILYRKVKIRAVVAAAFHPDDTALVFHLSLFFHQKNQSVETFSMIRSREDFSRLFALEADELPR